MPNQQKHELRFYLALVNTYGKQAVTDALRLFFKIENSTLDTKAVMAIVAALKSLPPAGYVYNPNSAMIAAQTWTRNYPNVNIPRAISDFATFVADLNAKGENRIEMYHMAIEKGLRRYQRAHNVRNPKLQSIDLSQKERTELDATHEDRMAELWKNLN